jgi:hypothetical protein
MLQLEAVCSMFSPDCCLICGQQIRATIRQQIGKKVAFGNRKEKDKSAKSQYKQAFIK